MRLNELTAAKADSIVDKFKKFVGERKDIPPENSPTFDKEKLPDRFSEDMLKLKPAISDAMPFSIEILFFGK